MGSARDGKSIWSSRPSIPSWTSCAATSTRFGAIGTDVVVAAPAVVGLARDKLRTAELLCANRIPTPRTIAAEDVDPHAGDWSWPVLLKPRAGSSSIGVRRLDQPSAWPAAGALEGNVVQELLEGAEYTVNLFFDRGGTLRCVIPHRRHEVRAGEVARGVTARHDALEAIGWSLGRLLPGARGPLCYQAIVDRAGRASVFEINARFGGGYPLAHHAGATFARWLLEEAVGLEPTCARTTGAPASGCCATTLRCFDEVGAMIIVFDMDDTLYLELDIVRSGFRAVDDWLGAERRVGGFFTTAWHLFEGGQRLRVFDDALAALGVAAEPGLVGELVEVYRGHRPMIQLAPDAVRALERHAGRDRLALLTDGYLATQERKIEALGLRSCCDPVIITDRWGRDYWKPHPRGFMAIQSRFDPEAADFVYIGDNPGKDFLAPKALGWKTNSDQASRRPARGPGGAARP